MHIYSVCMFGFCMQHHHPAFDHSAIGQLHTLFSKILHDFEVEVVKIQGETECVYLLMNFPPKNNYL